MFPYVEDDGMVKEHAPRRWRWTPYVDFRWLWWEFGFHLALIMLKGEPYKDDMTGAGSEKTFVLILDPRRWKVEQDHIYYDGEHCWYQFGPFVYRRMYINCAKCNAER
jgi:hypothetical protein